MIHGNSRERGTLAFYEANACKYANATWASDVNLLRDRFLHELPENGRILDAGCGIGRDVKAFTERGYQVIGIDASLAIVREARQRTGGDIRLMRIQDIPWEQMFNGIWAMASLLHIPRDSIPFVLGKLFRALIVTGAMFMSFKKGSIERVDEDGRFFCDYTEDMLRDELARHAGLTIIELWESCAEKDAVAQVWVNALVRRVSI
jgi:SAM-dependent methyltransferase